MKIDIRKRVFGRERIHHDGGPEAAEPLIVAWAGAIVKNPFAGRYQHDLMEFISTLKSIGRDLALELVEDIGHERVQVYGKAAIVGSNGELEHGAMWHEAGGWSMRAVLGETKALVPSTKAVGAMGYRLIMPLHHINACYVRSHFNGVEIGVQDGPRANEILYALGMGSRGRIHARVGGLDAADIKDFDGQR